MILTPALFALQQSASGGAGGLPILLFQIVAIGLVFWFLIIRPQQQKLKAHRAMVVAVKKGDEVITGGGLVGKVTKVVDDEQIEVEIADDIRIRQMRQMVTEVRSKGEPVKGES